ncbi:DUF5320 domain-containing protein [candidate division KSB1 bacterium]|nr:DUF5320 domain-containing protein [candidate division KSB1 bacterium]
MPGGDRTGPLGRGPMTGRAAGLCTGNPVPGYANPVGGRGMHGIGFGAFGRGRGHRHWFYTTGLPRWARGGYPVMFEQPYDDVEELDYLKNQAKTMQKSLDAVTKRIEELEKNADQN